MPPSLDRNGFSPFASNLQSIININNTDNHNNKKQDISSTSLTVQNPVKKPKTSVMTQYSPSTSQLSIINSTSTIETSGEADKWQNVEKKLCI